ncbi:MAG TPA: sugar transferase [Gaiellaceae bacterium]|nr:sugar transferase [Gaiellaceae bacterium]
MAEHSAQRALSAFVMRLIDVVVSGALLIIVLPIVLVVAAAIRLDSGGPVFFRCRRVGFRSTELQMLKFRKMRNGASGVAVTLSGDERFTRVGRVLAKAKIDELPQLWNVLKGEMTLVGPRPEHPDFVALRAGDYTTILGVKPGITGLCQLAFAKEGEALDHEDCVRDYVERLLPQKTALDLLYVDRRSVLMDLSILAWTAVAVLLRRDVAVDRSTARLGLRRRPPREEPVSVPATQPGAKL